MPGSMDHKLEARLPGEIATTSDMQMIFTLVTKREAELKSLLIRVKEESEKADLKLNIQKTMASSPVTSWQIERENVKTDRFYFLGLQKHCRWWLQP